MQSNIMQYKIRNCQVRIRGGEGLETQAPDPRFWGPEIEHFLVLLWLCWISNPQPLAHQSRVVPLSQKSRLRMGATLHYIPTFFLRAWYSHQQDITGYFPTNPQVRQATPLAIKSTMLFHPQLPCFGMPASQHLWTQMLWLDQVSHLQPFAHQSSILLLSQKYRLRLKGDTTIHCCWLV